MAPFLVAKIVTLVVEYLLYGNYSRLRNIVRSGA